jgi:hypothetical protein
LNFNVYLLFINKFYYFCANPKQLITMSKRNDFIWKGIQTVCWLIFAGYCVQTGALLFNFIYSLFNPVATHNLHLGLDLSSLYGQSQIIYTIVFVVIIAVSALKASTLFIALKLFKKLNLEKPFSPTVAAIITTITTFMFSVGIISILAHELFKKLTARGFDVGLAERYCHDGGAYLVMSAIVFVIALIFKRGIDLQNESELTV